MIALANLGFLARSRQPADAEARLRAALDIAEKRYAPSHRMVLPFRAWYALVLADQQRFEEAATDLARAYEIAVAAHGPTDPVALRLAMTMVEVQLGWHDADPRAGHGRRADAWRQRADPASFTEDADASG